MRCRLAGDQMPGSLQLRGGYVESQGLGVVPRGAGRHPQGQLSDDDASGTAAAISLMAMNGGMIIAIVSGLRRKRRRLLRHGMVGEARPLLVRGVEDGVGSHGSSSSGEKQRGMNGGRRTFAYRRVVLMRRRREKRHRGGGGGRGRVSVAIAGMNGGRKIDRTGR